MSDKPDDPLRGYPIGPICVQARVAVAFSESAAIAPLDERQMKITRLGCNSKGTIKEYLPGRGIQQIIAPHDMGDSLTGIIDDNRELIRGLPAFRRVAPGPNDKIADCRRRVVTLWPAKEIGESDGLIRDGQSPTRLVIGKPGRETRGPKRGGKGDIVCPFLRRRRRGLNLSAGQIARVYQPFRGERFHGFNVRERLIRLDKRTRIPINPQPCEQVDREVDNAGLDARCIEVFDAQHDAPAILTSQRPVDEKRTSISQVQRAGGRRGQTSGWGGGHVGSVRERKAQTQGK